jgi:hypothetical protein
VLRIGNVYLSLGATCAACLLYDNPVAMSAYISVTTPGGNHGHMPARAAPCSIDKPRISLGVIFAAHACAHVVSDRLNLACRPVKTPVSCVAHARLGRLCCEQRPPLQLILPWSVHNTPLHAAVIIKPTIFINADDALYAFTQYVCNNSRHRTYHH